MRLGKKVDGLNPICSCQYTSIFCCHFLLSGCLHFFLVRILTTPTPLQRFCCTFSTVFIYHFECLNFRTLCQPQSQTVRNTNVPALIQFKLTILLMAAQFLELMTVGKLSSTTCHSKCE
jgi:hypothetical protein